jgi:hypothetical protein
MSFVITAVALGTVGTVASGAIAAESQEDAQNRALGFTQTGIGHLQNLQTGQKNDPGLALMRQIAMQRLASPNPLDARTVEMMKASGADDLNRASQGAQDAISARAGASGMGRSGTTLAAQGRTANALGSGIAKMNRDIDIQAAMSQMQGEQAAFQMFASLLGIEQQPTRDLANAYSGLGAQAAQMPSAWGGFWNNMSSSFGGATAGFIQQQENEKNRALYEKFLNQNQGAVYA